MIKVLKTFQTFMEEALKKSLPELDLIPASAPDPSQKVLEARLLFEGKDMRAQAFLSCTEEFLQMTCPLPQGDEPHALETSIDWLGELGNLILGRLKNRLLAHDVTIKISAPDFAGNWSRPEAAESVAVWFECEGTLIGFDVAVEGRVPEIGEALLQSAEILPGDAIYRLNDTEANVGTMDLLSKIRAGVEDPMAFEETPKPDLHEREITTVKSFPMHFHNSKEVVKKNPSHLTLVSISWPSMNQLIIKFSNGLEVSLSPLSLHDMGMNAFELEGLHLHFQREGDLVRVSIPKLHINMSLSSRLVG